MEGRVISHPALGRPDQVQELFTPIQIDQIEVYDGFRVLKRKILSEPSGCHDLQVRKDKLWVCGAMLIYLKTVDAN